MKTIAISNQKGGTGKTTTAVNLSAALAERGQRILLLDLDPQQSASASLNIISDKQALGVLGFLAGERSFEETLRHTAIDNLDLLPATSWLLSAEKVLDQVGRESFLRTALKKLPVVYDQVLLDCPPNLGVLTLNALVAAESVLTPVEPHWIALRGLQELLGTLTAIRERVGGRARLTHVLLCRYRANLRHSRECLEELQQTFGPVVCRTRIRENIKIPEAASFGKSILAYSPTSTGAEDYRALAQEILEKP